MSPRNPSKDFGEIIEVHYSELEGFTGLAFWSLPSFGGEPKRNKEFIKKLETFLEDRGRVLLLDQDQGLDFEGFKNKAIVYLNNFPVLIKASNTRKERFLNNIECISLNVKTTAVIQENGQTTQANIYEESVYVDTSSESKAVENIALGMITHFLNDFFLANPQLEGNALFIIYD
jgi:hypothetical protein